MRVRALSLAVAAIACLPCASWAADAGARKFETVLAPTLLTDANKLAITGRGDVTATLDGNKLTLSGTFAGLTSPATDAHIMIGSGIGIPGTPALDLTVSTGTSGNVSGAVTLTAAQVKALTDGRLYVQINSQKAAAPTGNLWGWLLPEHIKMGQGEPQMGPWFLPQGEGLNAGRAPRPSPQPGKSDAAKSRGV